MFKLRNLGILGGEAKAGASIRLYSYIIPEEDTFEDLLADNYFYSQKCEFVENDIIMVFNGEKIQYLQIKEAGLRNIKVEEITFYKASDTLPLISSTNGSMGSSERYARADHSHPKAISSETKRGEIIIASQEETSIGTNDGKAITSLKLKNEIDRRQATDEEIENGDDVKKYINPLQIKTIKDNLQNNIDANKDEVDNTIGLINKDITDIENNKADVDLSNITGTGEDVIKNIISQNTALKTLENIEINNLGQQKVFYSLVPDYESRINYNFDPKGESFTIEEDGFFSVYSSINNMQCLVKVNNEQIFYFTGILDFQTQPYPIKKGDILYIVGSSNDWHNWDFYPLKQKEI